MGYEKDLTGKATLAAEDIRFARTIDRIQRIILSELNKIALVHLYTQGYRNESLTNFELSLTTPSIIYDQERIALMKEKVDLAKNIVDGKLLPTDWIYDNVFHLSQDQFDEYRDLIAEDQKRTFRFKQIENEGNDPLESGKSYGTPHDLAALYGSGRNGIGVPDGYDKDETLGRPKEKASIAGTQQSTLGKDRLGNIGMKKGDATGEDGSLKNNFKGGSPLALETKDKNKTLLETLDKKLSLKKEESSLLDESQIRE
jgi:hypothetical protein